MWPFLEEICFLGTNIAFFGANLAFLAQILLNLTFLHKISNFYAQNKPLSCLNTFFGANIGIFNAKIARLFWKYEIIVLCHSDVGENKIIALHLSHNTKTRAKFQATREVESLVNVMHTTHAALVRLKKSTRGGLLKITRSLRSLVIFNYPHLCFFYRPPVPTRCLISIQPFVIHSLIVHK